MPLILIVFSGLGLWLFSEFIAFSLVANTIGLHGAIIATLVTSFAGVFLLHRLGAAARQNLLAMLNTGGETGWFMPERLRAGLSAALGAVLLIIPGFVSDSVGLVLVARAAQAWWLSGDRVAGNAKKDDVLELSPREWRHLDENDRS